MKNDDNFEKKKVFTFRLRGSFLSVLLLIQVLMIGLSIAFGYLMISNLKDSEDRKTQSVTKHIQNEVRHRIYRSLLVTLNVAHDPETIEAFRKRDREVLLKVTADTWKQLQTHGITQFQFHIPTPQGIVTFLRVHKPDIYGEVLSNYRPLVVKCQLDRKIVSGLEQGKSGYGFRACAPIFYKDELIGSVELGSGFSEGLFKQLDNYYKGKWSLVNLERGIATIMKIK